LQAGLALGSLARVLTPHDAFAGDSPAGAQARWLAGLAPLPGIEPGAEWRTYAQAENDRWQSSQARVRAMQDWSTREIAPLLPPEPVVFYPFAGPDALHGLALFGGARRIVLVGLEPVGALPDPSKPAPAGFFGRLGAALADVHRLTFFRTLEMSNDFQREGVLAALVATIARMGGTVSSVQTSTTPPSARIDWTTATGQTRRLDYVQADLANAASLKGAAAPAIATVHGLAPYVTFVKAAMFLLAEPRFSMLKQMILDDSSVVLQDDTGIPFRAFDERWATRLFGRYEAPGAPYEERVQPALRAAYEQRGATALGFGIGYHVQPARSNLLVASKGHR